MKPMMKTYEAILSQAENMARLQTARKAIERVGGKIKIAPLTNRGMVSVTLVLLGQSALRQHAWTPDCDGAELVAIHQNMRAISRPAQQGNRD